MSEQTTLADGWYRLRRKTYFGSHRAPQETRGRLAPLRGSGARMWRIQMGKSFTTMHPEYVAQHFEIISVIWLAPR